MKPVFSVLLAGGVLLVLAGCAAGPNLKLQDAEQSVGKLSSDAELQRVVPVAVAQAEQSLAGARSAIEERDITHRAQLALIQVEIARAKARVIAAQDRAEEAEREAEKVELEARAEQAQIALRRAAQAQRRAEKLRAEAAAERQRIESERERVESAKQTLDKKQQNLNQTQQTIDQAQENLDEVKQILAELKPRVTDRGLVLTLGEVLFDFDSANLKPYTLRIMDRLANFLREQGASRIKIEGHSDSTGTAAYNLELSQARAESVAAALRARSVGTQNITAEGIGERRPIASNETEAGRRQNRRVEVIVTQS